ncbi:anti-sigma factor [Leptobacterium sp. I13]|uniref:anti-sigma factor n=1 Tax=Leptobacterium meishanense TaxID=3128904 RepID=UPI0030EE35A8
MKTEEELFLESGLLEKYLMGKASNQEALKVEYHIENYPVVNKQYQKLQKGLWQYAKAFSTQPPKYLKEQIIQALPIQEVHHRISWYYVAASIAAIVFASTTLLLWMQNNRLLQENEIVASEINILKNDILATRHQLDGVKEQFIMLNNPETQKYVLRGNQRAKNLKTVAYINPVEKLSLINIVSLPDLPKNQVYQMWADVNGEMISLGILNDGDKELHTIPFQENAISYNITIEPKGGNIHATLENIVANISLK